MDVWKIPPLSWIDAKLTRDKHKRWAEMTAHRYKFTVFYVDKDGGDGSLSYDKWFVYDPSPNAIFDGIDVPWRVDDHMVWSIKDGVLVEEGLIPRHRILKVEWTKMEEIGYVEYRERGHV